MKKFILHIFIALFCFAGQAQNELELLREGNKQFLSQNYDEAELSYQQALEKNGNYSYAMFNLGITFFVKEDFEKARDQFENAALTTESQLEKSHAYYNLASSYVMTAMEIAKEAQDNPAAAEQGADPYTFLEKGADALKDALRNAPQDEDARYNLAFLQKLMKQQPPQQDQEGEGDSDDQENQDQEKQEEQENKDGDKGNEEQENENDQSEDQKDEKSEDKSKEKKPEPRELSKEDAQRILEAIDRKEKDIREKMNLKKAKGERINIEKDW